MGKVALIHPPFPGKFNGIPMGLLYIASALKNEGHDIIFEDLNLTKDVSDDEFRDRIRDIHPEIVLISSTSPTHLKACDYARLVKDELGIPVVKGGSHETYCWRTTLSSHPEIDVSCIGDGEQTAVQVVNALLSGQSLTSIDGIASRNGNEPKKTFPRTLERRIDNYAHPDREMIPNPQAYEYDIFPEKKGTQARMSRGCSYGCTFCPSESPVRFHSADYVLDELKEISNQGYQAVFWDDSIFTLNRNLFLEILERAKTEGIHLEMGAQTRADVNIDEDTMRAMADCGVSYLSFGLESADSRMLNIYNKRLCVGDVERAVELGRQHGIRTALTAIIGAPNEDLDSVKRTVESINIIKPDFVSWSVFSVYPNTPMEFDPNWYEQPRVKEKFWLNFDEGFSAKHMKGIDYVKSAWDYIKTNTDSGIKL